MSPSAFSLWPPKVSRAWWRKLSALFNSPSALTISGYRTCACVPTPKDSNAINAMAPASLMRFVDIMVSSLVGHWVERPRISNCVAAVKPNRVSAASRFEFLGALGARVPHAGDAQGREFRIQHAREIAAGDFSGQRARAAGRRVVVCRIDAAIGRHTAVDSY